MRISPETEAKLALGLLVISVICCPLSMATWAKDEPPNTLALSWLALTFTAYDIWKTSRAHRDISEGNNE